MGTYYYTLRAKSMSAKDETDVGIGPIELAFFSYTYKFSSWDDDRPGAALRAAAQERAMDAAKAKHVVNGKVPYVVVGDKPENGLAVYKDVTGTGWVDSNAFPGTAYGYLKKVGRSWTVVTTYDSHGHTGSVGFETSVPFTGERYSVVKGVHRNVGYYCTMPDGTTVYVAHEDTAARAKLVAAWKPINEAKRAAQAREDAARKAAYEARKADAEAKKAALAARKDVLKAEMAKIDAEMSKLAYV